MNNRYIINVTRSIGNQSSLFQITNNVNCFYGENHFGESVRYVTLKWMEYKDLNEKLELAEDLKRFP